MSAILRRDQRAFPPDPPRDLVDPHAIAAHDWAAFQAVSHMSNHWDRPGWNGGRAYYLMLTFPDERALINDARACQDAVADPALDLVPSDGLHITLNKVADSAAMSERDLARVVQVAQDMAPKAFDLQVGPLAGSRGALRYSVAPWNPLIGLHAMLARAGALAGAPGGRSTESFRPHLGIAYSNTNRPADSVIGQVAALRGQPALPVHVSHADLVELRRENATYRWDVISAITLSHGN
ncbi:2'-5' RNA ligase family protein [Streptomyces sp. NBC_00328]|uniref:2'-5' RNA ligase family protein n=1 Tax=Streptomyces sp. NBC_00328 TaxID=2903646 RepID=UPI002E2A76C2|nr:2'-5' RNA ligase family protein [Streptomyces sp. NBC_00328]